MFLPIYMELFGLADRCRFLVLWKRVIVDAAERQELHGEMIFHILLTFTNSSLARKQTLTLGVNVILLRQSKGYEMLNNGITKSILQ